MKTKDVAIGRKLRKCEYLAYKQCFSTHFWHTVSIHNYHMLNPLPEPVVWDTNTSQHSSALCRTAMEVIVEAMIYTLVTFTDNLLVSEIIHWICFIERKFKLYLLACLLKCCIGHLAKQTQRREEESIHLHSIINYCSQVPEAAVIKYKVTREPNMRKNKKPWKISAFHVSAFLRSK